MKFSRQTTYLFMGENFDFCFHFQIQVFHILNDEKDIPKSDHLDSLSHVTDICFSLKFSTV